jgi:hypothetical protein
MTEKLSPQDNVIAHYIPDHQHTYHIDARDTVIIRWCPSCGKTWRVMRYTTGGVFTSTWEEIREPLL